MEYPVLASSSELDISAPVDLFAGSREVATNRATVGATALVQYQVVTLAANGTIIPYDGEADPAPAIAYITAVPAAANSECPYYISGDFNHEKLVWPEGVDTLAERKALFFSNPSISVSTILK